MNKEKIQEHFRQHVWSLEQDKRGVNPHDIALKKRQQRLSLPFYRAANFLANRAYPLAVCTYGLGKLVAAPIKWYRTRKYLDNANFEEQWRPIFDKYVVASGGCFKAKEHYDYWMKEFKLLPPYKVDADKVSISQCSETEVRIGIDQTEEKDVRIWLTRYEIADVMSQWRYDYMGDYVDILKAFVKKQFNSEKPLYIHCETASPAFASNTVQGKADLRKLAEETFLLFEEKKKFADNVVVSASLMDHNHSPRVGKNYYGCRLFKQPHYMIDPLRKVFGDIAPPSHTRNA